MILGLKRVLGLYGQGGGWGAQTNLFDRDDLEENHM
jgi:hypothetical protein